jgi:hypothetical protein
MASETPEPTPANKSPERREFEQAALTAWEEYVRTGEYHSFEAADGWLSSLAEGIDAAVPTPDGNRDLYRSEAVNR